MKRVILITGAGGNASVGFSKCLTNKKDYLLIGTDSHPSLINFAITDKKYLIPRADSPSYIKVLNEIIRKEKVDFLHVQPDKEIAVISKKRELIKTNILLPEDRSITIAQDKMSTYLVLKENEVPVPKSILISNEGDVDQAFKRLGSPVWCRSNRGAGGKGSLLVKSASVAKSWIEHWDGYGSFMISEYLPGKNLGWDSIWFKGKLVSSYTKERLEYAAASSSPSGISGTSGIIKCVRRSDIEKICMDTILAVDNKPNGIFSVDLKENINGKPYVTEINPGRFLSSSTHFFAESGYNLPLIYIELACGKKTLPKFAYPSGKLLIRSLDAPPLLFGSPEEKRLLTKMTDNYLEIK